MRAVNAHATRDQLPPFSPAAICWPARRPAPARPPLSGAPMLQRLSTSEAPPPAAARAAQTFARADPDADAQGAGGVVCASTANSSSSASTVVFGGVGVHRRPRNFKRGVDILVAARSPARSPRSRQSRFVAHRDLRSRRADRMLNMGFVRDIKHVMVLPRKRQNLRCFPRRSRTRSRRWPILCSTARIEVAPRNATVDIIRRKIHPVDRHRKRELSAALIGGNDWHQVLVFTRTKRGAKNSPSSSARTAFARWRSTETRVRARAPARCRNSRKDGAFLSRPTARHRHGANCRMSSTMICRTCRKTTCIGSAAPGAPVRPRRGDLAGLRQAARIPARHRAAAQATDPGAGHRRVRAGPSRRRRPDPAKTRPRPVAGARHGTGPAAARPRRRPGPPRPASQRTGITSQRICPEAATLLALGADNWKNRGTAAVIGHPRRSANR